MKKAKSIEEWEFSNQNWIKVPDTIWKYAPNRYGRGKTDYDENHPLVKRLKIKAHELMLIMSFLGDQGLIEYDKPDYNWINLTSKGFDVAIKNQEQELARRTNFVIVFLTAIIAFSAVVSLINAGLTWEARIGLIVFSVGLGFILFRVFRKRRI